MRSRWSSFPSILMVSKVEALQLRSNICLVHGHTTATWVGSDLKALSWLNMVKQKLPPNPQQQGVKEGFVSGNGSNPKELGSGRCCWKQFYARLRLWLQFRHGHESLSRKLAEDVCMANWNCSSGEGVSKAHQSHIFSGAYNFHAHICTLLPSDYIEITHDVWEGQQKNQLKWNIRSKPLARRIPQNLSFFCDFFFEPNRNLQFSRLLTSHLMALQVIHLKISWGPFSVLSVPIALYEFDLPPVQDASGN